MKTENNYGSDRIYESNKIFRTGAVIEGVGKLVRFGGVICLYGTMSETNPDYLGAIASSSVFLGGEGMVSLGEILRNIGICKRFGQSGSYKEELTDLIEKTEQ